PTVAIVMPDLPFPSAEMTLLAQRCAQFVCKNSKFCSGLAVKSAVGEPRGLQAGIKTPKIRTWRECIGGKAKQQKQLISPVRRWQGADSGSLRAKPVIGRQSRSGRRGPV